MAAAAVHPIQRPLKGSRISSFYPVKDIPPISALDSAFQLQEYISLLIRKDVHDVDSIVSIPGKGKQREGSDSEGAKGDDAENAESKEVTVDEACWIYEQLRRLAQDLSHPLITMLQQECTRQTCPEMKAGEWLYLCVAHGTEGAMEQCCAIDYILHTLDSATSLLNSPRNFPSRLSIPAPSHRHFSSLARRLGRIFAHAYFHHRAAFAQAEAESALYARFLALTSRFDLVPAEFLVIPPGIVGYEEHDGPDEYPRSMLGAALDPRRERERGREDEPRGVLHVDALGESLSGGDERREPSPRKMGRSRTDTMVHSEMASVVEELGRAAAAEGEAEGSRERVPTIRASDVQKKAEEQPETQTAEESEPAIETDPPVETEDTAEEDTQAQSSDIAEQVEVEPETASEDIAQPAEEVPPTEEADIASAETAPTDESDIASTETAPADESAEQHEETPSETQPEPTSEAEQVAQEATETEEETTANAEELVADVVAEPEAAAETRGDEELEPLLADEEAQHEPPVEASEAAPAEEASAEEAAEVEQVQADLVEEVPSEASQETTETEEDAVTVAGEEVTDVHPTTDTADSEEA
ncbi:Mob1/phocein [Fomitopsis serialis]|uniref:Mob1/phocein n=1 Tax=Fomitopsis serialis TaxID=139415 RepID=UPI00200886E7|nr:Mob1/phocein [Neoantrodia serialis]KAH9926691.1 Mob1/phocein [Neoantrodia serialis]